MAAAPKWKVYDQQAHYQASCHEIEAAACLMGFYGRGATIWTEGFEDRPAQASYDYVALLAEQREREFPLRLARKTI